MSKQIIRVVETSVWEYSPYDEGTKTLQSWYSENGRNAETIADAMEIDRKALLDTEADDWVPLDEFATKKVEHTAYAFNIVTVPDDRKC